MAIWTDYCAARGPALTHAHWTKCVPPAPHPTDLSTEYAGRKHEWNQCCHCEERMDPASQQGVPQKVVPAPPPESQTLAELEPEDAILQSEAMALPVTCTVDHRSIDTALLIGDDGLVWRRCPFCNVQVEGALRKGEVIGPYWGPGRGELRPRQQGWLQGWVGWVDYQGKGR